MNSLWLVCVYLGHMSGVCTMYHISNNLGNMYGGGSYFDSHPRRSLNLRFVYWYAQTNAVVRLTRVSDVYIVDWLLGDISPWCEESCTLTVLVSWRRWEAGVVFGGRAGLTLQHFYICYSKLFKRGYISELFVIHLYYAVILWTPSLLNVNVHTVFIGV